MAGFAHTCGTKIDGTVVCWGQDLFGEASPPKGEFVSVSAGWQHHTCGVKTDGTVACWGDGGIGQATAPEGEFASVSARELPHLWNEDRRLRHLLGL